MGNAAIKREATAHIPDIFFDCLSLAKNQNTKRTTDIATKDFAINNI